MAKLQGRRGLRRGVEVTLARRTGSLAGQRQAKGRRMERQGRRAVG